MDDPRCNWFCTNHSINPEISPARLGSLPSGESDPSVMLDLRGADTQCECLMCLAEETSIPGHATVTDRLFDTGEKKDAENG
jgi:hypothetical protein